MSRERVPIKIKRVPITAFSDRGYFIGGWYAFPKPDEPKPFIRRLKKNEKVLWCPWCGGWEVFRKGRDEDRHFCTGICGWGNDNEFYVKTYNDLWWGAK